MEYIFVISGFLHDLTQPSMPLVDDIKNFTFSEFPEVEEKDDNKR